MASGFKDFYCTLIENLENYDGEYASFIDCGPNLFRLLCDLLDEDVDIRYIQEFLGHSSISTTEIYTHVSLSRQKEILSQKHPRNKLNVRKLDENTNDNQ